MAGLVEEIQAKAIDPSTKVSDLLRMVKLAATKLKLGSTVAWVDHELSGYFAFSGDDIPQYRHGRGQLKERVPNVGIQAAYGDAKTIAAFSMIVLRDPISSIEDLATRSEKLAIPLDPDLQDAIHQTSGVTHLFEIHFGPNFLISIISAVKDLVLDWACELEQQGIMGEGISFTMEEKQKAAAAASTVNIGVLNGSLHSGDMNGGQSRTNVNSTDNSNNSITTENVFQQLTQAIESNVSNHNDRDTILGIVKEMEKAKGTADYVPWFQKLVGYAADYATVLGPFLPALSQLG